MRVNDIIVLENKQRYVILKETTLDNNRYFMAAPVDKDDNMDEKKLVFLKLVYENNENYVVMVKDDVLIFKLSEIFADAIK